MPDMYFDVDTAITECPVNLMPLIDDTDFKTRETAIAYNAAGMDLVWNFVTSAGALTQTAVTPTTAGNYDWTHQGDGIYTIEIPASGGASINNDTEGYGWFSGVVTGVLPFRGPVIGFRAAALNDALCDGGDNLDVNTVQWLGTACATPTVAGVPEVDITHIGGDATSATDLKDFADAGYDPATNKVQGVVLVDTCTTATTATNVTTVNGLATNVITAAATAADFGTEMAAAVWNTDATSYQTQGTFGQAIGDPVADTNTIYKAVVSDATGATVGVDVVAMKSDTAAILVDTAEIGAAGTGLTALATQASVTTIDDFLDTEIAAIKAVTDAIGATGTGLTAIPWNAAWDAEVQSEVDDAINTAISELGVATPTATPTLRTGMMLMYMALRNKLVVQTSGTDAIEIYNDAGTKICSKAITDDGSDYTESEMT